MLGGPVVVSYRVEVWSFEMAASNLPSAGVTGDGRLFLLSREFTAGLANQKAMIESCIRIHKRDSFYHIYTAVRTDYILQVSACTIRHHVQERRG